MPQSPFQGQALQKVYTSSMSTDYKKSASTPSQSQQDHVQPGSISSDAPESVHPEQHDSTAGSQTVSGTVSNADSTSSAAPGADTSDNSNSADNSPTASYPEASTLSESHHSHSQVSFSSSSSHSPDTDSTEAGAAAGLSGADATGAGSAACASVAGPSGTGAEAGKTDQHGTAGAEGNSGADTRAGAEGNSGADSRAGDEAGSGADSRSGDEAGSGTDTSTGNAVQVRGKAKIERSGYAHMVRAVFRKRIRHRRRDQPHHISAAGSSGNKTDATAAALAAFAADDNEDSAYRAEKTAGNAGKSRWCSLRNIMGGMALTGVVVLGGFYGMMHWCAPDLSRFYDRSQSLYDKGGNLIYTSMNSGDYYRILTTRSDVDPLYIRMLIAAEDERFYSHAGVDVLAVGRALWSNITSGRTVSGASTLAMQVCRMLEPKDRSLWSKVREALGALYLTHYYGREQLLSIYLTLAPFGSNIESVTAASWIYFNHSPRRLTPAEAALLVALPRSPEVIRPDRHPESARYYRNEVLKKAVEDGIIKRDILEFATAEPVSQVRHPLPDSGYYLGQSIFNGRLQTLEIQALRSSLTALLAKAGFTLTDSTQDSAAHAQASQPSSGTKSSILLTGSSREESFLAASSVSASSRDAASDAASQDDADLTQRAGAGNSSAALYVSEAARAASCPEDHVLKNGRPVSAAAAAAGGDTTAAAGGTTTADSDDLKARNSDTEREHDAVTGVSLRTAKNAQVNSENNDETIYDVVASHLNSGNRMASAEGAPALSLTLSPEALEAYATVAMLSHQRNLSARSRDEVNGNGDMAGNAGKGGIHEGAAGKNGRSDAALKGPLPRELYTTIDPRVQKVLLDAAALYRKIYVGEDGQESLAMVVVDNDTFEVLGYVGALGRDLSYVDAALALRSPGSTLKPFAYGMAFERGLLHPNSILLDAPRIYNSYQPRNYNRRFYGELTASLALQASLNLPAVEVMRAIGPYNFINRLNSMENGLDVHSADSSGSYVTGRLVLPARAEPDLSVVLGGCGITLFDLTQLYASLAHDGGIAPLRVLSPRRPSSAVFHKYASRAPLGRLAARVTGHDIPVGSQAPTAATEVDRLKDGAAAMSSGNVATSVSDGRASAPEDGEGVDTGLSHTSNAGKTADASTGAARQEVPTTSLSQVNALSGATPEPGSNYVVHGLHVHYQHLLSAPAARAVYNVLEGTPAPTGFESAYYRSAARISYKTGTSYRNRDAWAVGSSNNITLGIWTGRLDGNPAGNYTGYNHAAPLLFEIMSRLTSHDRFKRRIADDVLLRSTPPAGLDRVSIARLGLVTRCSQSSGEPWRAEQAHLNTASGPAAAAAGAGAPGQYRSGVSALTGASGRGEYHTIEPVLPLTFTFPTDGTRLSPGSGRRVNVVFSGGVAPYFMLVNDQLVPQLDYFEPRYNGFHTITIIDRNGDSISSQVWIEGVSVTSPELDHGYRNPDGPDYVDVTEEEEEGGEAQP